MQITRFKKILYSNRVPVLSDEIKVDKRFKHLCILRKLTERIEFGCDFVEDGLCKGAIKQWKNETTCCCGLCYIKCGYLHFIIESDIKEYSKLFNEETGFWKKGVGCTLPRIARSRTCLLYSCNDPKNILFDSIKVFRAFEEFLIEKYRKEAI